MQYHVPDATCCAHTSDAMADDIWFADANNSSDFCVCLSSSILTFLANSLGMADDITPFTNTSGCLLDSEDCFYYYLERNNVVVLFGTLKVQSFILTEVSDCGLLIVVTSSIFLKRKDMLKEKSS